jgi:hypothetical protein
MVDHQHSEDYVGRLWTTITKVRAVADECEQQSLLDIDYLRAREKKPVQNVH